jgi:hypothetical protein
VTPHNSLDAPHSYTHLEETLKSHTISRLFRHHCLRDATVTVYMYNNKTTMVCLWLTRHHQPFKAQQSLYVPPGLTFTNSTFCPHSIFMCFVLISEQTAIISLYSINWLVFITETECVYCAVRTESSNITQVSSSL